MAKANQTFFIPESIRRLRLSSLSLSRELALVLRRLGVATLDDLCGVSLRDFQRVSVNGTASFLEIGRLIERARRGDFAIPPIQNAILNPVSNRRPPALNSAIKAEARMNHKAVSEVTADEMIFIPLQARGKLLATFPLRPAATCFRVQTFPPFWRSARALIFENPWLPQLWEEDARRTTRPSSRNPALTPDAGRKRAG